MDILEIPKEDVRLEITTKIAENYEKPTASLPFDWSIGGFVVIWGPLVAIFGFIILLIFMNQKEKSKKFRKQLRNMQSNSIFAFNWQNQMEHQATGNSSITFGRAKTSN